MRDLTDADIDRCRDRSDAVLQRFGSFGDHTCGRFVVVPPGHLAPLLVVAAAGDGWDHVSVSGSGRCPTWTEMEAVKRMFFRDDECAMQLHVPPSDHINNNPYVLHVWRPHDQPIPRPPVYMV